MSTITKMNKRNKKFYGEACEQCNYYPLSCRCNNNNTWKNKDMVEHTQKIITKLRNKGYFTDQSMDAPVQSLGRELLMVIHHIELSGKTVTEVLEHIDNNFTTYG